MSYTKKTWVTGEYIEASELNHIEEGIYENSTTKAPLASPALTGTPTTPTPGSGAGNTQIANKKYVDDSIVDKTGNLSGLSTTAKTTLVAAINEVDGDLSHLPSPASSNGLFVISQDNGNMSLTDMSGAMLSLFGLSVVDGAINLTYQE